MHIWPMKVWLFHQPFDWGVVSYPFKTFLLNDNVISLSLSNFPSLGNLLRHIGYTKFIPLLCLLHVWRFSYTNNPIWYLVGTGTNCPISAVKHRGSFIANSLFGVWASVYERGPKTSSILGVRSQTPTLLDFITTMSGANQALYDSLMNLQAGIRSSSSHRCSSTS